MLTSKQCWHQNNAGQSNADTRTIRRRLTLQATLQYHRAKSLRSTLLGTGQFSCRHSEVGAPFIDMKLHTSGWHSGERELKRLSKPVARVEHPHYPLI